MKHISSLRYGIRYNYILFEFLHLICFIVFFNLCPILVSTSIDVFWLMNNILLFLYRYSILFFLESFNLWRLLLMITLYHQTKTPISFSCRQKLNSKFLIQLSETLPVELIRTHDTSSSFVKKDGK